MSVKGQITTAEPLEFKDFIRLLSGLHEDGNYLWELYCCISFCTACRVSDVRSMTWKDVLERDALYKIEQKTGKTRQIPFNENVQRRISSLYKLLGSPDKRQPVICNPKTKKPLTIHQRHPEIPAGKVSTSYQTILQPYFPQNLRSLCLRIDGAHNRSSDPAVDDSQTFVATGDNDLSGYPAGRDCRSLWNHPTQLLIHHSP